MNWREEMIDTGRRGRGKIFRWKNEGWREMQQSLDF